MDAHERLFGLRPFHFSLTRARGWRNAAAETSAKHSSTKRRQKGNAMFKFPAYLMGVWSAALFVALALCGGYSRAAEAERPEITGGYKLPGPRRNASETAACCERLERTIRAEIHLRQQLKENPKDAALRHQLIETLQARYAIGRMLVEEEIGKAEAEIAQRLAALQRIEVLQTRSSSAGPATAMESHVAAMTRYRQLRRSEEDGLQPQLAAAISAAEERIICKGANDSAAAEQRRLRLALRGDLDGWRKIVIALRTTIDRLAEREKAEMSHVMALYS